MEKSLSQLRVIGNPKLQDVSRISQLYDILKEIGGFSLKDVMDAVENLIEMYKNPEVTVFFSFTANIIATGMRAIISEMIAKGLVDVIFTTGGTIDHDIAKSLGAKYYEGFFEYDDIMLEKSGFHRLGNIIIPKEDYGPLIEHFTHRCLEKILNNFDNDTIILGVRELLWKIGSEISDENSILRQAYKNRIPIYSPGVTDSAFGTALMTFREVLRTKGKKLMLDVLKDLKELSSISFKAKKIGGIVLGGGISKHHLIWWAQFSGGLDYAVYITTAIERDGSLSGARTREAITWGKIKPEAKHITVYGDVTLIFPLMLVFLYEKLGKNFKREPKKLI